MTEPTPYPYQLEGAGWLASRRFALLADEPGVGKSAQVVRALDQLDATAWIVCPAVARPHWQREFARWSERVTPVEVMTTLADRPRFDGVVIVSYEYARENRDVLAQRGRDVLVLDEGHKVKSPDTAQARALLGRDGLVHRARRLWVLTGTPTPNHPGELWPFLRVAGVTQLSYEDFVYRYCVAYRSAYGLTITGARAEHLGELRDLLISSGVFLRRTKEDVNVQLPPISFHDIPIELPPVKDPKMELLLEKEFVQYFVRGPGGREEFEARVALEEKLVHDALSTVGFGGVNIGRDTLGVLEALAGSVSTLRRYVAAMKVTPVAEIIYGELEANAYGKIAIMGVHQIGIEGLRAKLERFHPVTIYGKTPPDKRQRHIDRFMTDPSCRVFIGNIGACGTAINLTSADQVAFLEADWTPGNNMQAAMRCHRHGQTRPVTVRFFSLADSLDQKVMSILRRKTASITKLIDGQREGIEIVPDATREFSGR